MLVALLALAACRAPAPAPPARAPVASERAVEVSASIRGVVRSETGEPLAGVTVLALNSEARWAATAVTDEEGRYDLDGLASGAYEVLAFNQRAVARRSAHVHVADVGDLDLAIDSRSRRPAV